MLSFRSKKVQIQKLQKIFTSLLLPDFSLDETSRVEVAGHQTPLLKNGTRTLNLDHAIVDDYASKTGEPASIFGRCGDSFIRIATTVRDTNGNRALGTTLEPSHAAYRALVAGRVYCGYSIVSGKKLLVLYSPIFDGRGSIIGALAVGIDITNVKAPNLALKLSLLLMAWAAVLVTGSSAAAHILFAATTPMFTLSRTVLNLAVVPLFGAGVYASVERMVSASLRVAEAAAQRLAKGDLSEQMPVDRGDEIGRISEGLNGITTGLASLVRNVTGTMKRVTDASHEIASGNTDLSARTEQQASSLEETAASMTQLTETVRQNADNARHANSLAANATGMADTGNDSVQAMVETIGQISSSSRKISEITGVIEGIAFQTNILALNAAVEAARAGEQGRGFAVVASEVRSLAQRSAAAAKEIKDLIGSSVTMIQDGAKQATGVSATMGQVKQAIKQVSDIVGEIAAASEEQSRGIEQVNQAVGQMEEVTQQNAALVEQAAAAAQSLEDLATKLKDAVSVFKVADTEQSTSHRSGSGF